MGPGGVHTDAHALGKGLKGGLPKQGRPTDDQPHLFFHRPDRVGPHAFALHLDRLPLHVAVVERGFLLTPRAEEDDLFAMIIGEQ